MVDGHADTEWMAVAANDNRHRDTAACRGDDVADHSGWAALQTLSAFRFTGSEFVKVFESSGC